MRVLELCVGGWGSAFGLVAAGATEVVGWDIVQRRDVPEGPFTFVKGDVRDALADVGYLRSFDFIWTGFPCKENTRLGTLRDAQGGTAIHKDMLVEGRAALDRAGVPYVLENVPGAAMRPDLVLCGTMFAGLSVWEPGGMRYLRRHRLFELGGWGMFGIGIQPAPCCSCFSGCSKRSCGHAAAGVRPLGVYGSAGESIPDGGQTATLAQARELLGMPWASWESLTQAVPPAYSAYVFSAFLSEQRASVSA